MMQGGLSEGVNGEDVKDAYREVWKRRQGNCIESQHLC